MVNNGGYHVCVARTLNRPLRVGKPRVAARWLRGLSLLRERTPRTGMVLLRYCSGIAPALRRCCERVVPLYNPCTSLIYPLYIPCSLLGLSACLRSRHRAPCSYRPPRSGGYSNEVKGHAPEPARRRQPETQGFRLLDTIDVNHAVSG